MVSTLGSTPAASCRPAAGRGTRQPHRKVRGHGATLGAGALPRGMGRAAGGECSAPVPLPASHRRAPAATGTPQQWHRHDHVRSDPTVLVCSSMPHHCQAQPGHMGALPAECRGSWHVPAPSLPSAGSPVPRHPPRALLRHLRWGVPSQCHCGAGRSAKGDPPGRGAATGGIPFPVSRGWEGLGPILASPCTQLRAQQNTTAPMRVRNPKVLGLRPKPRLQLLWAQRGPSQGWLSPAISSAQGRCPRGGPGPALGPTGHGDRVTRQGGPWASPGGWWPWGDAVAREVTRRLHVMPGAPRAGWGDGRGTGRHGGTLRCPRCPGAVPADEPWPVPGVVPVPAAPADAE